MRLYWINQHVYCIVYWLVSFSVSVSQCVPSFPHEFKMFNSTYTWFDTTSTTMNNCRDKLKDMRYNNYSQRLPIEEDWRITVNEGAEVLRPWCLLPDHISPILHPVSPVFVDSNFVLSHTSPSIHSPPPSSLSLSLSGSFCFSSLNINSLLCGSSNIITALKLWHCTIHCISSYCWKGNKACFAARAKEI